MIDYDQVINTLILSALQIKEFEEMIEQFKAKHSKEARVILEDKLQQEVKKVLAYYFGE